MMIFLLLMLLSIVLCRSLISVEFFGILKTLYKIFVSKKVVISTIEIETTKCNDKSHAS